MYELRYSEIKSISAHLGGQDFPRLRIGVGEKPRGMDLANDVLGKFSKGENEIYDKLMPNVAGAIECMVWDDVDKAMNDYNKSIVE